MVDGRLRSGLVIACHPGGEPAGVFRFVLHFRFWRLRGAALLLVVDFLEIGVDDFVIAARTSARPSMCATAGGTAVTGTGLFGLLRLVESLADLHRCLRQGLCLGLDLPGILATEGV